MGKGWILTTTDAYERGQVERLSEIGRRWTYTAIHRSTRPPITIVFTDYRNPIEETEKVNWGRDGF